MKRVLFVFTLALLFGCVTLNSCKEVKPFGETERGAISDTINLMMAKLIGHAEAANVDSTFQWLSSDSSSWFVTGGFAYKRNEIISLFKTMYGNAKSQKIELLNSKVLVFSPESAAWIAVSKGNIVSNDGKITEQFLSETWIWQREAVGWRVIHYHESVLGLPDATIKAVVEKGLAALAATLSSKSPNPVEMPAILTDFLKKHPTVYGATLAFAPTETDGKKHTAAPYIYRSGNEFKQVDLPEAYDYTVSEWYALPVKSKTPCWSNPYYDAGGGGVVMITYSIPLYNNEGNLTGVLTSDLEVK